MPFGKRRSSILAFYRRLTLLGRLLRGPAGREALFAAVDQELGPDALGPAPERVLESDLAALRREWDAEIRYERAGQVYRLAEIPFPLIDLSEPDLTALAFLYSVFTPEAPQGPAVRALLDRLVSLLPGERRRQVERLRTIPDLELGVLDPEGIAPDVWEAVEQAAVTRRQLSFRYRPLRRAAGAPEEEEHRVEPYGVAFVDGHYYLEGHCARLRAGVEVRTEVGRRRYRLSRLLPGTVQVLPDKLPPGRRPARTYTLRYRLAPTIAGGGVSPRFPETRVTPLPDGWVEVEAQTVDLWRARQVLLRYAENCRVLEPPELVQDMREAAAAMARLYEEQ
jgi:predicted DNA-binding transcriptional regulator YafY